MPSILSLALGNWRALLIGGAAIALAGWALHERDTLIAQGAEQERQTMEKANAEELRKAAQAATSVDACYRGGGSWDRDRGVCVSPSASEPPVRRHR